jgi:hypothetical protein
MGETDRVSDEVLGIVNEICAQIEAGLGPFADEVFANLYGTTTYADKENARRAELSKERQKRIPQLPQRNGFVTWEFSLLINTITAEWKIFESWFEKKGSTHLRQVRADLEQLSPLRARGLGHARGQLGSFTEDDLLVMFIAAARVVRAAGASEQADILVDIRSKRFGQVDQSLDKLEAPFLAAELMRLDHRLYNFITYEAAHSRPLYLPTPHEIMKKPLRIGHRTVDIRIPVTVLTRAKTIRLEPLLDPMVDDSDPRAAGNDYVERLTKLNSFRNPNGGDEYLYNNTCYTMKNVTVSGDECTITGSISNYFSMLATHDAMEFELLSNLAQHSTCLQDQYNEFARRLALRQRFFAQDDEVRRKHAALSILALFVYKAKRDGRYKIMIRKRSDDVAAYRGLLNVIPAGMFQPEGSEEKEWSIQHCLIKEYSEELFGERIPDDYERPTEIYRWDSARALYEALRDGRCKMLYSGLILNLLMLRPHICCVLLAEDPAWFEDQEQNCKNQEGKCGFRSNWEHVSPRDAMRTGKRVKTEYDLEQVEAEIAAADASPAAIVGRWNPDALAALFLGIDAISEYRQGKRDPVFDRYPY